MTKTTDTIALQCLAEGLAAVLARENPNARIQSVAALFLPPVLSPLSVLASAVMRPALEPLPPQLLVDLLKEPFCVGQAQRLVLEQLARHYQRSFADQREFVEYVRQQRLDLDLTTPPKRPRLPAEGMTSPVPDRGQRHPRV